MYSPNTIKNVKIAYLTWNFILHSADENTFFEYLREIETEFKDSLRCESGAHMGSINERNQRTKISCYCPFKLKQQNL